MSNMDYLENIEKLVAKCISIYPMSNGLDDDWDRYDLERCEDILRALYLKMEETVEK